MLAENDRGVRRVRFDIVAEALRKLVDLFSLSRPTSKSETVASTMGFLWDGVLDESWRRVKVRAVEGLAVFTHPHSPSTHHNTLGLSVLWSTVTKPNTTRGTESDQKEEGGLVDERDLSRFFRRRWMNL